MTKVELYHNDMSSCSQKVRLVLEEKSIRWTGHHMNLRKGETRTKTYIKNFNKNGVVPTLVYKNDIIIESSIIMEYLEDTFPQNGLRPSNPANIAQMRLKNRKIDDVLHSAIAIISSCIAFRHQFLENNNNEELTKIINLIPDKKRRDISKDTIFNGLDSKLLPNALLEYIKLFNELDVFLSNNKWLAGNHYSLADAAYTPYLTRFEHLNLSFLFEEKKYLCDWFFKVKQKENYTKAILKWNNNDYLSLMKEKGKLAKSKIVNIISKS